MDQTLDRWKGNPIRAPLPSFLLANPPHSGAIQAAPRDRSLIWAESLDTALVRVESPGGGPIQTVSFDLRHAGACLCRANRGHILCGHAGDHARCDRTGCGRVGGDRTGGDHVGYE